MVQYPAIEFQIVNWYTADIEIESSDSDNDEESVQNQDTTKYTIKIFGVDENGRSISVTVTDFTPHFYVKVYKLWSKSDMDKLASALRLRMGFIYQTAKIDIKPLRKKDFWGFTNQQDFWFLRICFDSQKAMRAAVRQISSPKFSVPRISQQHFKLYESNIEPFLRFAHIKNIQPAGWIRIPEGKYRTNDILQSKCEIDICTRWSTIESIDKQAIAPLLIASFDLECTSSDGDFPVPVKDYKRFAIDIFNMYNDKKRIKTSDYYVKKEIINYIVSQFENKMVYSKQRLDSNSLKETLHREIDYLCTISKGDISIMKKAFRETFNSYFTKPINSAQTCIEFFEKIKSEKVTMTALRKSMNKWLENYFNKHSDIFNREKDTEEAAEELIKLLFCDKDAIINVMTDYMNEKFPELKGDEIIQIGTTFHRYGSQECHRKVLLSLGTCDPIDGIEVIECEDEADLILNWTNLINESNPDIITGYNIFGFDFDYIFNRSEECGVMRQFCQIGRLKENISKYKVAKLSSSALGDNLMKYVDMEGRTLIDLMKVIQREYKLDSYKLDNVASHFMNQNKHDVSPQDIFNLYKGNSKDRSVIGDYCIQDCNLCNKLIMKLEIIANNVGMANVCSVPMSWIFMRGQGVKIFSLVAKQCKDENFLVPAIYKPYKQKKVDDPEEDHKAEEEGYEGAIVLEPKTGIYIDTPISVLDYASLYPSSMISENLSHDCIVLDDKYDNLPGVEYLDISYDLYEQSGDEKRKVGQKTCRFVQPADGEKGIIPNILMHLLKQRKLTRKKIELKRVHMKDNLTYEGLYKKGSGKITSLTGDSHTFNEEDIEKIEDVYDNFQKAVLDGLQLAYKITANSLYGQVGAKTSPIYFKDIAACTTATGRKMIMLAKDFVEKEYNADVVYGDSVTGYTPTILRVNGNITVETMDNIAEKYGGSKWIPCVEKGKQTKVACELDNVEVWTEDGWTRVHRIIKHQLAEHKKIVRVLTHTGVADVTDDHSLLRPDKTEVSSKDLKVGDLLLHSEFPHIGCLGCATDYPSPEEARIMGMFMGDGSCGAYDCDSGKKCSWAINNFDMIVLQYYKELCEKVYPEREWKILDTIKSSGVYKLVNCSHKYGGIKDFVIIYRTLLYHNKSKIVPNIILNAPYEVRRSFWDGFYDADGDKKDKMNLRLDQKSQISALTLSMLASSLGFSVSFNTRIDKPHIYRVTLTNNVQRKNPHAIKKMYNIDYTGEVYDLTTDNHHFHIGTGKLIGHNTDSLFIAFPEQLKSKDGEILKGKEALQKSIDIGVKSSDEIKPLLRLPHDLEYEKCFFPMILFSKKRYCANKYEHDVNKFKQVSMGIVLKRRDNANIVKQIYGGIIDIILNKHDVKESIAFLKQSLKDLIDGKFPLEDLIITKTLKARYKDPSKIAHKVLAERIKERSPGSAPQVNDRIPFIYVQVKPTSSTQKLLQGDRIEHPDYIIEKKLKPDYEFYLTNQIMNPVLQLYALIVEQLEGYRLPKTYWTDIKTKLVNDGKSEKKVRERLAELREVEVKKLLFDPILIKLGHMKTGQTQITSFFTYN